MNITLSNVAIREHNGLYSINDLHRASGGEKRHQPSDWLRLKQTIELIKEAEKTGNPVIISKQGLGTFACKELICAYATWISPKFFLQVIRTFLAVQEQGSLKPDFHLTAQTTPDERKPLRDAVFALAAQYGLAYSTAYKMVHQRFNVEAIEAIPAEQIPLAVEYVHRLTLNGEVLDRLPETGAYAVLSERELSNFATATYYLDWATRQLYDLSEPLKQLGARDKGVAAWTLRHESHSWLKHCRETLQRVQPEMRDAYFREHVAGSLRRMDALMRG